MDWSQVCITHTRGIRIGRLVLSFYNPIRYRRKSWVKRTRFRNATEWSVPGLAITWEKA